MSCSHYTSDQDYVTDIREGGYAMQRASDCLYRAYRTPVIAMVRSFLRVRSGVEADALDLVQDAFLVMLEKIRGDGYKDGSLLHFWTGITKGLLRNKFKRDARMDLTDDPRVLDEEDSVSPEHILLSQEKKAVLDAVLDKLGGRCKDVLLLWAGGYSMEEIAARTGLSSEAMARKTKYRCKNQLMDLLDQISVALY
jgi:RNA polymerase sigma factor (sigma-70 family)